MMEQEFYEKGKHITDVCDMPVRRNNDGFLIGEYNENLPAHPFTLNELLALLVDYYGTVKESKLKREIKAKYGNYDDTVFAQVREDLTYKLDSDFDAVKYTFVYETGDQWFMILSSAIDDGYRYTDNMVIEKWILLSFARYAVKRNMIDYADFSHLTEGEYELLVMVLDLVKKTELKDTL